MPSYANKFIIFSVLFYTLLIPSTISSAQVEGSIKHEGSDIHLQKTDGTAEKDMSNFFVNNIQTINSLLSSSYSDITEQAEYYYLGKLNSTMSSEVQKWLSQFVTSRISFGLDRDWTLKNNSIDILIPIYDNKVDWLLFSQFGYRNKDSRNTVNTGLGGRYFYNNWMYGLNTFYDHDVTGRNRRFGLGGEVWSDYTKFSANIYHRLSDWQDSRNLEDYYERPATGYDINSEFFLSAYPSFGMKLAYEQYFGDHVTLFNRDTKQKNPRQAKLGLTYTPIPLITFGIDYRQGEKGNTETQFLASLNYKFGIPLNTQIAPDNVASMRTLLGSRYDLVERNNDIILDHKKREQNEFLSLGPIIGYGHQEVSVNAPIRYHANIKHIGWIVVDKEFKDNNGKLSSDSGKSIVVTLPSYQEIRKSDYMLDIVFTDNQDRKKVIQVPIRVLPFLIDGKVNITPPESPEATGREKNGYTFSTPVITYQGLPTGEFVKNAKIDKVAWATEPALGDESGLSFTWNNESAKTNEKGQLTDEAGKLISNILVSKKPHSNVKIYIQLDGAPRQEIGLVKFSEDPSVYHIERGLLSVNPPGPLTVGDGRIYTFSGTVVDRQGNPVIKKPIDNVIWKAIDDKGQQVNLTTKTTDTNDSGALIATLDSAKPLSGVVVSLAIENQAAVAADPVSIKPEKENIAVTCEASGETPVLVNESYTCTATVSDKNNKEMAGKIVNWSVTGGSNLQFTQSQGETDKYGAVQTKLTSSTATSKSSNIVVIASVEQHGQGKSQESINFIWPKITIDTLPKNHAVIANGQGSYKFTATILRDENKPYKEHTMQFAWAKPQLQNDSGTTELSLSPLPAGTPLSVNPDGTLTTNMTSRQWGQVKVCIDIVDSSPPPSTCSEDVQFALDFEIAEGSVEVYKVNRAGHEEPFDSSKALSGDGKSEYLYRALIIDKNSKKPVPTGYPFRDIKWTRNYPLLTNKQLTLEWDKEGKTDEKGYLYAKLKSSVGVKEVNVTLGIADSPKITADTAVEFIPITQPAVLYVYNTFTNASKYFDNKDGKNHPRSIFGTLRGELRASKASGAFDKTEITYGIKPGYHSPIYGEGMLSFGVEKHGPIQFIAPGTATITATINKKTGEIQSYEYNMFANKYVTYIKGYKDVTDNISCESQSGMAGMQAKLFLDKEVSDSGNKYSLHHEFGNIYNWGVFDDFSGMDENKVTVIVKNTNPSISSDFRIFNFIKNTFDDASEGVVLCYATTIN